MAHHGINPIIAQGQGQRHHIRHLVGHGKGYKVSIIVLFPARGSSEAPHIRGNYMKSSPGQGQQIVPPGVGKLREAVKQQHQRAVFLFKARLQNVQAQAVDRKKPGTHPGRQPLGVIGRQTGLGHKPCSFRLSVQQFPVYHIVQRLAGQETA